MLFRSNQFGSRRLHRFDERCQIRTILLRRVPHMERDLGPGFVADQLAGKSEGLPLGGGGPGGRGPGGPGGFGPGNFVGPVFFKAADGDSDGKVTQQELTQLAERWFREWDKAKSGKLKQEDLASGLNAVVPPPDFGRPPQ